jgi:hypothetical protein
MSAICVNFWPHESLFNKLRRDLDTWMCKAMYIIENFTLEWLYDKRPGG